MTFPANYAVIAEDELTYVTGGGVIANVLPAVMTSENWKTFGTNLVKIVGNSFMAGFVSTILGTAFGGSYKFGGVVDTIPTKWEGMTDLNRFMQVLGGLASIYTLGTDPATTAQADGVVDLNEEVKAN